MACLGLLLHSLEISSQLLCLHLAGDDELVIMDVGLR